MKKLASIIVALFTFSFMSGNAFAATTPVYDATYNNNHGALYANGTDIIISQNTAGQTVVTWDGGSQIVPNTVSVFGGGREGTNFETSNIVMEGGTVQNLVAGGLSTENTRPANIGTGNITVNGGNVTDNVVGGGYLYTNVNDANLTINNGTIGTVEGGGFASVVIDGVSYESGTEDAPQNSGTRVNNADITINNGTIYYPKYGVGLVYGGGQGYSYTGNSNLIINGGNLSGAYVTAGGSNGYTGTANVNITGGNIGLYQTVNRGIVENAETKVEGGTIANLYVGGETNDPTVTGTVNSSDVNLLGGTITNLNAGKSNLTPIIIDNNKYSLVKTNDVTITNDNIPSGEVTVTYDVNVIPEAVTIAPGETTDLRTEIITIPVGYEDLFRDKVEWSSSDENVASVDDMGLVTGVNEGITAVTATLGDKTSEAEVTVEERINVNAFLVALGILLIGLLIIFLGVFVL